MIVRQWPSSFLRHNTSTISAILSQDTWLWPTAQWPKYFKWWHRHKTVRANTGYHRQGFTRRYGSVKQRQVGITWDYFLWVFLIWKPSFSWNSLHKCTIQWPLRAIKETARCWCRPWRRRFWWCRMFTADAMPRWLWWQLCNYSETMLLNRPPHTGITHSWFPTGWSRITDAG